MPHTTARIEAGKDRYGAHLMIDDFRCAMPSIEVAKQLAAAPALLEALVNLMAAYRDSINGPEVDAARKAVSLARGI